MWSLTQAASAATPRSGLATASTGWPASSRRSMTGSQLEDSANAPWTSTMVGRKTVPFRSVRNACHRGASPSPPPPCESLVRALGCRERRPQLLAGADAELREHLVQVVLDGARADEQLGADLRVSAPVLGEPGHLRLLRGELVTRLDREPAHRLARRGQLAPGALRERLGAEAAEHLVRGAQLLSRVQPATLAPEPFAVEQTG